MKKLERMLLMNWHNFSLQVIPFEMITFLTGKNSSGKSTIIDAMQLVLLGDTSGTFLTRLRTRNRQGHCRAIYSENREMMGKPDSCTSVPVIL